ncbi:MAG: hypothetical protein ACO4CT_18780 [Planctomycetota bacterium]
MSPTDATNTEHTSDCLSAEQRRAIVDLCESHVVALIDEGCNAAAAEGRDIDHATLAEWLADAGCPIVRGSDLWSLAVEARDLAVADAVRLMVA